MSSARCAWCGTPVLRKSVKGPAPKYCRPSHRQRAYEQRRLDAAYASDPKAERGSNHP